MTQKLNKVSINSQYKPTTKRHAAARITRENFQICVPFIAAGLVK